MRRGYKDYHKININNKEEKRCTVCGNWFLMNGENFGINNVNKDKLNDKCRVCQREHNHKYYMKDPVKWKKIAFQWQKDNPEKSKQGNKKQNNKPERKALHREVEKKRREEGKVKEWQNNNPEKLFIYGKKRRIKNHNISKEEWINCKNYFNNKCAYCGLSIDEHFVLRKGKFTNYDLHKEHVREDGSNTLDNCVPACQSCNSQKWIFALDEWYNINNPVYFEERYNKIIQWLQEDYKQYIVNTA